MAIQPIDLSTMYSQMDKVAKYNASVEQTIRNVNNANVNKTVQENLEKTKQVQKAQDENNEAVKVRPDGKNNNQQQSEEKKKEQKDEEQKKTEKNPQREIKDPLLGQHIDITR